MTGETGGGERDEAGPRTRASADAVTFGLADPRVTAARVWLDTDHHSEPPAMAPVPGGFALRLPRPPVQRLEYLFAVRYADGTEAMICDPATSRAPNPFGDHSVVFFPGYREPAWLTAPAPRGTVRELAAGPVPVALWSPEGAAGRRPLPLLVLHDGPEYDAYCQVLRYCAAGIAGGWLPPHRVALLGPGDRNRWYAASPGYARTLTRRVLPLLRRAAPVTGPVVLGGFSLGALAALHAAGSAPRQFSGLFLQSGSFFRAETDGHESGFAGYAAVTAFVRQLARVPPPVRWEVELTCGLGEENLGNNRLMAAELAALGHRVALAEVPDAHTFTGWRDAFDPHLTGLLRRVWRRGLPAGHPAGRAQEGQASAAQPA